MSAASAALVLVKNGRVLEGVGPTANAFLMCAPRGAYTTARTHGGLRSVFDLSAHVRRLAESARLMDPSVCAAVEGGAGAGSEGLIRARLAAELPLALDAWAAARSAAGAPPTEAKITVLVAWGETHASSSTILEADAALSEALAAPPRGEGGVDVFVHVTALNKPRRPIVRVQVRGHPRSNAAAKDSEWVRARRALEEAKPDDVEEVLLCDSHRDSDGHVSLSITEGTQTNFFAVDAEGALVTAREGVLLGTVRSLVLDVCRAESSTFAHRSDETAVAAAAAAGIPVRESPPLIADMHRWRGALLSSTSRLALPIHELAVPIAMVAQTRGLSSPVDGAALVAAMRAEGLSAGGSLELEGEDIVRRFVVDEESVAVRVERAVAAAFAERCEPVR